MSKLNLTVMLSLELPILVQIWYIFIVRMFFSLIVKRPFPLFKSFLTYCCGKFIHYYLREKLHFGSVL
jgi:hypothetical protein